MARQGERVRDAWLDLVLGSQCVCCGQPGRVLCPVCRVALHGPAFAAVPDPCPDGLLPVHAAGVYSDGLRAAILAHKERRAFALAAPLGHALAAAVTSLWRADATDDRFLLVPVPSRRSVTAARGHDPLVRAARIAAAELRAHGASARVVPLLRQVSRPMDQAGLGAAQRAANLAGRFGVRTSLLRAAEDLGHLVLVDDVITTGATLRESQRALEEAGLRTGGAAVMAATLRRSPSR